LKENISQLSDRANIPWLKNRTSKRKEPVPNFLDDKVQDRRKIQKRQERRDKQDQLLTDLERYKF